MKVKKQIRKTLFTGILLCIPGVFLAQEAVKKDSVPAEKKENRNVMLNASSSTGPRDINVGLPAGVGGTLIIENGLPVVYTPWPEHPTKAWRKDAMLNRFSLANIMSTGVRYGEVGYSIETFDNLGTDRFQGNVSLQSNDRGLLHGTGNISGPINKKGLQFSVGAYVNYDPGTFDVGYTDYGQDQTQMYKAALTQNYKFIGGKGKVSIFYKYIQTKQMLVNFSPFVYKKDGKVEEYNGIKIGETSFFEPSGIVEFKNPETGAIEKKDVMNDFVTRTNTVDLISTNEFTNGLKLNYTFRYHKGKVSLFNPALIRQENAGTNFSHMDGTPYTGDDVYLVLKKGIENTPITSQSSIIELTKKNTNHNWRLAFTQEYYNQKPSIYKSTMYYQEVKKDPAKLQRKGYTDEYGNLNNYNSLLEMNSGSENRLSLNFQDSWILNPKFVFDYGVRLETLDEDVETLTSVGDKGLFADSKFSNIRRSYFNKAAQLGFTYKAGRNFGFTAEGGYNEAAPSTLLSATVSKLDDYKKIKMPNAGLSVYFNHPMISFVSKGTYIKKSNNLTRTTLTHPTSGETTIVGLVYDIATIGWTTDVIFKPFRGFNFHFLLTLQNPQYKKYSGSVDFQKTGEKMDFNFDNNVVTKVPKILMEIDPSYQWNKFRIWASARYFGKTFANLSNTLYFAPRWETFGGVNYALNKHLDFSVTIVNILNQRGAQGTIGGTDLFSKEDVDKMFEERQGGLVMAGTYIRPFTAEFSMKYKF